MNKSDFTIHLEERKDDSAVENLVRESFWNVYRPGCSEHFVIHVRGLSTGRDNIICG